jgi:hypothetical protein
MCILLVALARGYALKTKSENLENPICEEPVDSI